MIVGALLDLMEMDERISFIESMNCALRELDRSDVTVAALPSLTTCGIAGTRFDVRIGNVSEESRDMPQAADNVPHCGGHANHSNTNQDESKPHHEHTTLAAIQGWIGRFPLSDTSKVNARAVFDMLAEAESHVHGRPIDNVHFHEIGSIDAALDIACACALIEKITPDEIVASPIQVGEGFVRCSHGLLPVPAPATAWLLRGIPIRSGAAYGEMCTPTGAALIKFYVKSFGSLPEFKLESVGYGIGTKQLTSMNAVRAFVGNTVR